MKTLQKTLWIFALIAVQTPSLYALTILKGKEAVDYVGDPKQYFVGKKYTYEVLARSHRDSMNSRFSDGTLFNPDGGNFGYPRRKDSDYIILIDDPNGREEEPVTEDIWRQKLQNVLSDDNNNPYVFLDDDKKELAVLYVGNGTKVRAEINGGKLLKITLTVPGASNRHHRRAGGF